MVDLIMMTFSDQKLEVEKSSLRENFPTIINSNSKIAGDILLQTDIRVDGSVYGLVESDNNIFIGTEGYVKGLIRAKNLVSFGRIEGTVVVQGVSILHPSSILFGKLYTREIDIHSGAYMSGFLSTCDQLAPIDEAQIVIDEQRTKMLSKRIKTDQETFHEFPINYIINQHISNTLISDLQVCDTRFGETQLSEQEKDPSPKYRGINFANDEKEFEDLPQECTEGEKKSLIFESLFKLKST